MPVEDTDIHAFSGCPDMKNLGNTAFIGSSPQLEDGYHEDIHVRSRHLVQKLRLHLGTLAQVPAVLLIQFPANMHPGGAAGNDSVIMSLSPT